MTQAFAPDYHDFADYYLCNGTVTVFIGYGFGITETIVYRHDRDNVGRYGSESVHHTIALLVYLQKERRNK